MGDVSIIARRLSDQYVQYGWSGNGGYFKQVGNTLLAYYDDPEMVEYLFGLGQLEFLWEPYSENWHCMFKTTPEGRPHWVGRSEREIFSKITFTDLPPKDTELLFHKTAPATWIVSAWVFCTLKAASQFSRFSASLTRPSNRVSTLRSALVHICPSKSGVLPSYGNRMSLTERGLPLCRKQRGSCVSSIWTPAQADPDRPGPGRFAAALWASGRPAIRRTRSGCNPSPAIS